MKKIKLWIDDIRNAPSDEWVIARTITDAIRILAQWDIEEISLDHDISHQVAIGRVSRPYPCDECFCAVAYFILEKYVDNRSAGYPKITLHTSNPVGAEKMKNILKDGNIDCEIKMTGIIANRLEMEV